MGRLNLACRLQQWAGTNEIWIGDLIKTNAEEFRQKFFVTPENWTWTYYKTTKQYPIWHYDAYKKGS